MNILPGLISVLIFIAVFVSNCISLRCFKTESVKSYPNIASWVINCAFANFVHCLFILPIGIGLYSVESKDFQSIEDIWMGIETPISLQFHSVALLSVIFFEYVRSKRLTRRTYAFLTCIVIISTVLFMVPSVIIKVVYTESNVTNVTNSFNTSSRQDFVSTDNEMYALLCTTITAVVLPCFLLIVCHPFSRQNFSSGRKGGSFQCLNSDGKSPFMQPGPSDEFISENNYDTDDVEPEHDGTHGSFKNHLQSNSKSADERLDIKLKEFRDLQRRLHECGMLTSSIEESDEESRGDDSASVSETTDTEIDRVMVRKFYINVVLHFLFWCPWITINFINFNCQHCEISKTTTFFVSLIPCIGMIFTPVLIIMPNILKRCT